jgi:hypothetical protein
MASDGDGGDSSRVTPGEWLSGLSSLVLVVSLFAPWEHRRATPPGTEAVNAWRALGVLALVLVLVADVALWHLARRLQGARGLRPLALVCAGAVGVTVVLYGLSSRLPLGSRPAGGLFVGLVAAAGVAVGGAARIWLFPARPASEGRGRRVGPRPSS